MAKITGHYFVSSCRYCNRWIYQRAYGRNSALGWLSYGQTFGFTDPAPTLDLGVLIITFGLKIKITIGSIVGIIIAAVIYRFV